MCNVELCAYVTESRLGSGESFWNFFLMLCFDKLNWSPHQLWLRGASCWYYWNLKHICQLFLVRRFVMKTKRAKIILWNAWLFWARKPEFAATKVIFHCITTTIRDKRLIEMHFWTDVQCIEEQSDWPQHYEFFWLWNFAVRFEYIWWLNDNMNYNIS